MRERLHRTQLLLEPVQHRALVDIAQREGRSISEIVRTMIAEQLDRRERVVSADLERRLEALDWRHSSRSVSIARQFWHAEGASQLTRSN